VTIEEKVTVGPDQTVSTEATANANQTVISGSDLDALPDDPDELAAALQALAGPSVGPNGGKYLSMASPEVICHPRTRFARPHKSESVCSRKRSASGRIDILTRPGTDKLRGVLRLKRLPRVGSLFS
jgi:hypothetical protein